MGKCYDNPENDKDNNAVQNTWKTGKEAFKQKTLEEAAEMYVLGGIYLNEQEKQQTEIAFYEGANWQAERMYSEEEVIAFLLDCRGENPIDVSEWFEQNKKK